MTSTIQSTVASALASAGLSQYTSHAEPVVTALEERDYQLVELITARVSSQFNVPAETVQSELANIGMAVRPTPEPEPEAEDAGVPVSDGEEAPAKKSKKGKKGKGDKRVARIEATVNKLVELAERHLGASV
jgi:hypothetical protein